MDENIELSIDGAPSSLDKLPPEVRDLLNKEIAQARQSLVLRFLPKAKFKLRLTQAQIDLLLQAVKSGAPIDLKTHLGSHRTQGGLSAPGVSASPGGGAAPGSGPFLGGDASSGRSGRVAAIVLGLAALVAAVVLRRLHLH